MFIFIYFLFFCLVLDARIATAMPIPHEAKNLLWYLINREDVETEAEALEVLNIEEINRREALLLKSLDSDEFDEVDVLKALVSLYMESQDLEKARKWSLRLVSKVVIEGREKKSDVISQYVLLEYASKPSIATANNLIEWVNRDIFPSSMSLSVIWSIFCFVLTDKNLSPDAKKSFIDDQEIWYIRGLQKEQIAYDIDGLWHWLDRNFITFCQYKNLSEAEPLIRWSPAGGYDWSKDFRLMSRAFYL